jgi:tungstate transport system substrate-binding protein
MARSRQENRRAAWLTGLLGLVLSLTLATPLAGAEERFVLLGGTTTTDNSGLLQHVLPRFTTATGIEVRSLVHGTGQILELGRRGDLDVLIVHHREAEERFVAEGFGLARHEVMANDFLIVGPARDPAQAASAESAAAVLNRIAETKSLFISRGDDSGTHRRELSLWQAAGVDPRAWSGRWYRETGAGMGATLTVAATLEAYSLADRATWLSFANKQDLKVLFQGGVELINPYGVIAVDPRRHPHVRAAEVKIFIEWLLGPAGQEAIASFRIDGRQAFRPTRQAAGSKTGD